MMNIKQIAEHLRVSEQSAYGLMQFLQEIGHVTVTDAPNVEKKRGRRPKLYQLSLLAVGELELLLGRNLFPANAEVAKAA